jgi:hypothetical protein
VPSVRSRMLMDTTAIRTNATGRPMMTSTAPMRIFLTFMVVLENAAVQRLRSGALSSVARNAWFGFHIAWSNSSR